MTPYRVTLESSVVPAWVCLGMIQMQAYPALVFTLTFELTFQISSLPVCKLGMRTFKDLKCDYQALSAMMAF